MPLKRKKTSLAHDQAVLPGVAPASLLPATDFLLDNLVKAISDFGFRQVFPPPVEDRRFYLDNPLLAKHFGAKIWRLEESHENDLVLNPTYFFSTLKRYLETSELSRPRVAKWFYIAPVLENFPETSKIVHEVGMFILGEDTSLANAHLINVVSQVLEKLGVGEVMVEINSLGCKSCQKDYQEVLGDYFCKTDSEFCSDCATNLSGDVLSLWGCSNPSCREQLSSAPPIIDFLDESCRLTLVGVLEILDQLEISYSLSPVFASPLLEKVVFRFAAPRNEVLGVGGNYTSLLSSLGASADVPLLGFLTSLEKLENLIPAEQRKIASRAEVFLVSLGELASRRALIVHRQFRQAGIMVAEAMLGRNSIKAQLKEAYGRHCDIALIIGQKEAIDETVILRDIRSGMQEVFACDRIIEEVRKRLGG